MPIIVSKQGKDATRLDATAAQSAALVQQWVANNPHALPIDEIKGGARLVPLARQFPTAGGLVDLVAADNDGEIYVVEGKLFGIPDQRQLVLRVLECAAALWRTYRASPERFLMDVDVSLANAQQDPLNAVIAREFEYDEVTVGRFRDEVHQNLAQGHVRFVLLVDRVTPPLADLVSFLNARSDVAVHVVQLEMYRHGDEEIVIARSLAAEHPRPGRGATFQWLRFRDQAVSRLGKEQVTAIDDLYAFSRGLADGITWHHEAADPTFSPRLSHLTANGVYQVSAQGVLSIDFRSLAGTERAEQFRDRLARALENAGFCAVPPDYRSQVVAVRPDTWMPKRDVFKRLVRVLVDESTPAAAVS
jgi:hypothetical protein